MSWMNYVMLAKGVCAFLYGNSYTVWVTEMSDGILNRVGEPLYLFSRRGSVSLVFELKFRTYWLFVGNSQGRSQYLDCLTSHSLLIRRVGFHRPRVLHLSSGFRALVIFLQVGVSSS